MLEQTGYTSGNLMHAVDWLPTLMTAIGRPGLANSATDGNIWVFVISKIESYNPRCGPVESSLDKVNRASKD